MGLAALGAGRFSFFRLYALRQKFTNMEANDNSSAGRNTVANYEPTPSSSLFVSVLPPRKVLREITAAGKRLAEVTGSQCLA